MYLLLSDFFSDVSFFVFLFFCLYLLLPSRFEIPGIPQAIRLSQDWDKNPEYKYFGRGLTEGECGVSIQKVQAFNNGKVKCVLGLTEDELFGEIDLTVACKY